jgi:hypothetical protein
VEQFAPPAESRPFLLTLCRLSAPVVLPKSNTTQLNRYSFFMGRSRGSTGAERLMLHFGYFRTREEAEKSLQLLRVTYPKAIISSLRLPPARNVPTLQPAGSTSATSATSNAHNASLTDTQVLRILETRRPDANFGKSNESAGSDIALVRPDDTNTRRALKDAVATNAPVHFAVQLQWSAQPINLATVPRLDIFRAYTLYVTEDRREGCTWFCLRLGFFGDPISARQVAHYVRTTFAAVSVVPIIESERERAGQTRIDRASLGASVAPVATTATSPVPNAQRPERAERAGLTTRPLPANSKPNSAASAPERGAKSLEQTLEMLAASELFSDGDSLADTGVRHLSFSVQKRG